MLTLISATNRKENLTRKIARFYLDCLLQKKVDTKYFSLEELPQDFYSNEMYDDKNRRFIKIQEEIFYPAKKFIFITPEYHGSYPGVLKLMLDVCEAEKSFAHKKTLLVGVADGMAGNQRGLDQLAAVLNHLKMNVHYNKLKISGLNKEMDETGKLTNPKTISNIHRQIDDFLAF